MSSRTDDPVGVVPCRVSINVEVWSRHQERIERLRDACPHVRFDDEPSPGNPRAVEHTSRDAWGCLWQFPGMGLDGQVIEHPLDDWEKMNGWRPPSTEEAVRRIAGEATDAPPREALLEHGFNNFVIDVAEDEPRLYELRDTVADYWYAVTEAYLDAGAGHVNAGDDLGLQDRLPISPESWRKLIKPAYARIFGLARERGATVFLHTDGYIVDIIEDLIEVGVTDLNPQDLVNGLGTLEELAEGKTHVTVDVDRQRITAFGSGEEIDAHIKQCVETLGSKEGGLSLIWGVYPGTPIENIEATVRAMEKYRMIHAA